MKDFLLGIGRLFLWCMATFFAFVLAIWVAVYFVADSPIKNSFNDTARLAKTLITVSYELVLGHRLDQPESYALRPSQIKFATLLLMKDSGVSGIFSMGGMTKFSKPEELKQLVTELNRFLDNQPLDENKLIRKEISFYLIIIDQDGQRRSYEYIGQELFFNNGTVSRLLRPNIAEGETFEMADLIPPSLSH